MNPCDLDFLDHVARVFFCRIGASQKQNVTWVILGTVTSIGESFRQYPLGFLITFVINGRNYHDSPAFIAACSDIGGRRL